MRIHDKGIEVRFSISFWPNKCFGVSVYVHRVPLLSVLIRDASDCRACTFYRMGQGLFFLTRPPKMIHLFCESWAVITPYAKV